MLVRLKSAPVEIDHDAIAKGIIDHIRDDHDEVIQRLRFGLISVELAAVIKTCIRETLAEGLGEPDEHGYCEVALTSGLGFQRVHFEKAVAEATRLCLTSLFDHVEMVS